MTPRSSANGDQMADALGDDTGHVDRVDLHGSLIGASQHQQALDEALQAFGLLTGSLDVAASCLRIGVDVDGSPFELQTQRGERCAQLMRGIAGEGSLAFDQGGDLLGHRVERHGQAADLGWTFVDRSATVEVAGGDVLRGAFQASQGAHDGGRDQCGRQRCGDERDQTDDKDAAHLVDTRSSIVEAE